jgi:hypothetical protein
MRIPLLSWFTQALLSLFPLPHKKEEAKNFFVLRNSHPFSVWHPKDPQATQEREDVISHFLAQHYYKHECSKIIHGYRLSSITNEAVTADVIRGDLPDHPVPRDDHYWYALCKVTQLFAPPHKIRPVHFADLRLYPWNKSTNVEAPYSHEAKYQKIKQERYNSGIIPDLKNSFSNFQDYVFFNCRRIIHIIKNGDAFNSPIGASDGFLYYHTTHAKTSVVETSSDDKIRMVFGSPKLFIFAEAMFFWPLFAHYMNRKGPFPILWNYSILSGGWLRLNNELHIDYLRHSVIMFDLKQFDKRALYSVIDDIADGWMEYFDFEHGYQPTFNMPTSHVDPNRLKNLWYWTCFARKHIPILLPDGRILARLFRGVASGMFTTQFLDSVYNAVMLVTVLASLGIYIDIETALKLMGDDSLGLLPIYIPPDQHDLFKIIVSQKLEYYFDAILSPEKSKIQNSLHNAEVLSYFNRSGFPYRDEIELAARFFHTRARKPSPSITMAQCIGTAYAIADPETRLYDLCSDIYSHYESLGFTPDLSISSKQFYVYGDEPFPPHFPSRSEITKRLTTPSERNPKIAEKYWPSWFFITEPSTPLTE